MAKAFKDVDLSLAQYRSIKQRIEDKMIAAAIQVIEDSKNSLEAGKRVNEVAHIG